MNKLLSLLVITLLFATSLARAEDDSSGDLRYCLELQSNYEIAKCAGEISAGIKGKPYTKEEVDKKLSEQQAKMPATPIESSEMPASGNQIKDILLEQDEGSSNK
jgi:hypothetical protein